MRTHIIVAAACAAFMGAAQAAGPTTQVLVHGDVTQPGEYDLARLLALPQVTQTDIFLAGSTPQTHTYTGGTLWATLNDAGVIVDPGVKNDVLNKIVVATGSDGYKSVFSLGELSPNFGNRQSLVATSEVLGGAPAPLGADGFARVTAPGDVRGGRYVSNLAELTVRGSGSTQGATTHAPTTSFEVRGAVARPATFDLADLEALPTVTRTVGTDTYTGVRLWDLLNTTTGLDTDPNVKNDVLGMYVVATGSDGYKAVFSMGEIDPLFGNEPDMIAFEDDGVPLTGNGFARIVAPDAVKAGRGVSNLVSLEVVDVNAVPEPARVAMMLAGLAAIGLAARRRPPVSARRVAA